MPDALGLGHPGSNPGARSKVNSSQIPEIYQNQVYMVSGNLDTELGR